MSGSRLAGRWRGAYSLPRQDRSAERCPVLTSAQVARSVLGSALVPICSSAERGARSPCSRFLSKGQLGSICLLEFQASRSPWRNEGSAKGIAQLPSRPCGSSTKPPVGPVTRGRFDENHSEIAGYA